MNFKLVLVFIGICGSSTPPIKTTSAQVEFFEEHLYQGLILQVQALPKCINIPRHDSTSEVSSIITEACIMVYTSRDCGASSNTFTSIKLPPGHYPNMSQVCHWYDDCFDDKIESFHRCTPNNGEQPLHVELLEVNITLVEYQNVQGCINIPKYAHGRVTALNNHGNCVQLYAGENCTEDGSVGIQGGVSIESRNLNRVYFY